MKKVLLLFLIFLSSSLLTQFTQAQDFTVNDDGIVMCEGADPGDTGTIFGDTYEAVDRDSLDYVIKIIIILMFPLYF